LRKLFLVISIILFNAYPNFGQAYETSAKYAIVMDYETGTVLYEKNADQQMVPSSMTKLMTAYVAFERLQNSMLKLDDEFTVSEKAWRKGGSKMFLRHTERVTIDELLNGIIVQSGNDACITLAEGISSSEAEFAKLMNKTAKKIGLTNSNFVNSTGWPDKFHYMSARDLAILSRQLIKKFPEYYHYFAKQVYKYSNIKQSNRNTLLFRDVGVDGLKTGHTEDGGYGIAVSGKSGDSRVIVVVNGLDDDGSRADEAERLLSYGFRGFENKSLFKAGQVLDTAQVWQGEADSVSLSIKEDVNLIIPKLSLSDIKVDLSYKSPIASPIKKGDEVGEVIVKVPNMDSHKYTLVASEDVKKAGAFNIFVSNIKKMLMKN